MAVSAVIVLRVISVKAANVPCKVKDFGDVMYEQILIDHNDIKQYKDKVGAD